MLVADGEQIYEPGGCLWVTIQKRQHLDLPHKTALRDCLTTILPSCSHPIRSSFIRQPRLLDFTQPDQAVKEICSTGNLTSGAISLKPYFKLD